MATTKNAPARHPVKDDGGVGAGTPIWDAEFADRWRALHDEPPVPHENKRAPRRPAIRRPGKNNT